MKYQWVLFDADETLFEYDSFLGLSKIMQEEGYAFTKADYQAFQAVSKPLWLAYQKGEISARELARRRFDAFIERTNFDAEALNDRLQLEMAKLSPPIDGVVELLQQLHGKVGLAMITNGFDIQQMPRLQYTGLVGYFDAVITSEAVGFAKPDQRIFQAALKSMNDVEPHRVLMVGDGLTSDILGGNQIGMKTCWFNPKKTLNDSGIYPDYEIHHMSEIWNLLSV